MSLAIQIALFYFTSRLSLGAAERVMYISVEHPKVSYYNTKFLKYGNLTCRRYGRENPVYYVGLNFEAVVSLDDSIHMDFYFYELLTNQYKPSFIEMHFKWCELVEKNSFFGATMRQGKLKEPNCPYPPGVYQLANMTVHPKLIPRGFPFTRGRIYLNVTQPKTKSRVADGYVDIKLDYIDRQKAEILF